MQIIDRIRNSPGILVQSEQSGSRDIGEYRSVVHSFFGTYEELHGIILVAAEEFFYLRFGRFPCYTFRSAIDILGGSLHGVAVARVRRSQPESYSWNGGACTVADASAHCTACLREAHGIECALQYSRFKELDAVLVVIAGHGVDVIVGVVGIRAVVGVDLYEIVVGVEVAAGDDEVAVGCTRLLRFPSECDNIGMHALGGSEVYESGSG